MEGPPNYDSPLWITKRVNGADGFLVLMSAVSGVDLYLVASVVICGGEFEGVAGNEVLGFLGGEEDLEVGACGAGEIFVDEDRFFAWADEEGEDGGGYEAGVWISDRFVA